MMDRISRKGKKFKVDHFKSYNFMLKKDPKAKVVRVKT